MTALEVLRPWFDGEDLRGAALAYAMSEPGFPVFPLRARDKIPAISKEQGGNGFKDATRDRAKLFAFWPVGSLRNIGIATGAFSGFDVLDVDPRHGGNRSLAELEHRFGPLPRTAISLTGGPDRGRHILFNHTPGVTSKSWDEENPGPLGPGLDIRADGGYVVAPPSVHASGLRYAWDPDHHLADTPIAEAPEWLVTLVRKSPSAVGRAELPENWRKLVANGVGEGARNDAIARLAGLLLRRHIDTLVALDLVRCWNFARCRPPLDDAEVMRTFDSIAGAELHRREAQ